MKVLIIIRQATLIPLGQSVDGCGGMVVDGIARRWVGRAPGEGYAPALQWKHRKYE